MFFDFFFFFLSSALPLSSFFFSSSSSSLNSPLLLSEKNNDDATRHHRLACRRSRHGARDARGSASVSTSETYCSRRRFSCFSFFFFVAPPARSTTTTTTTSPPLVLLETRRPRRGLVRLAFPVPVQGMGRRPDRRQAYGREHQGTDAGDSEGSARSRCESFCFFVVFVRSAFSRRGSTLCFFLSLFTLIRSESATRLETREPRCAPELKTSAKKDAETLIRQSFFSIAKNCRRRRRRRRFDDD